MKLLATLLRPDAGRARVFGHDVVAEADAVRGGVGLTAVLFVAVFGAVTTRFHNRT